jgi:hypothetical protein
MVPKSKRDVMMGAGMNAGAAYVTAAKITSKAHGRLQCILLEACMVRLCVCMCVWDCGLLER